MKEDVLLLYIEPGLNVCYARQNPVETSRWNFSTSNVLLLCVLDFVFVFFVAKHYTGKSVRKSICQSNILLYAVSRSSTLVYRLHVL